MLTKILIILFLLIVLLAFVAYHFRKQLQTAWIMWQAYRKFREHTKPPKKQVEKKTNPNDTQLVRCPKCNKWTPQSEAVKLKSNFYCSLACMEKSVSFNK